MASFKIVARVPIEYLGIHFIVHDADYIPHEDANHEYPGTNETCDYSKITLAGDVAEQDISEIIAWRARDKLIEKLCTYFRGEF